MIQTKKEQEQLLLRTIKRQSSSKFVTPKIVPTSHIVKSDTPKQKKTVTK